MEVEAAGYGDYEGMDCLNNNFLELEGPIAEAPVGRKEEMTRNQKISNQSGLLVASFDRFRSRTRRTSSAPSRMVNGFMMNP
jgi:hypothetical protein